MLVGFVLESEAQGAPCYGSGSRLKDFPLFGLKEIVILIGMMIELNVDSELCYWAILLI